MFSTLRGELHEKRKFLDNGPGPLSTSQTHVAAKSNGSFTLMESLVDCDRHVRSSAVFLATIASSAGVVQVRRIDAARSHHDSIGNHLVRDMLWHGVQQRCGRYGKASSVDVFQTKTHRILV